MRSIVDECREILAAARAANDNRFQLRLAPQKRVNELIVELHAIRLRGHVYEPMPLAGAG